jgi:hypothetical protein
VITAGLPEYHSKGMDAKRFLKEFYRVKGIKSRFDALGVHAYAADQRGVKGYLERTRNLLRRVGDRRRAIWVTEFGYASGGGGGFLVSSESGQARKLRKTIALLQRERKRFKLGTITSYRWRDTEPPSGGSRRWPDYAGLFRDNGSVKPACRAYVRFTGGSCGRIDPGVQSSSRQLAPSLPGDGLESGAEELQPSPPAG